MVAGPRQIRLWAFIYPTGHHLAAWRHPASQADAGVNLRHHVQQARIAERGLFAMLFLSDVLAVLPRQGKSLSATARISRFGHFEPVTLLSALAAVMQNTVPISPNNSGTAAPQITEGQVRAIAVAGPRRLSWAPEVETLAEQGLAGLDSSAWTGVFVAATTPDAVVDALHAALAAALAQPEVVERLERIRFVVEGGRRADLAARIAAGLSNWRGVVRDAGIEVN